MERKWCCLEDEEAREMMETSLIAYGVPLSQVTSFKYIGRVLDAEDSNWPEVVRNLRRARQKWSQLTWVLNREG